MSNNETLEAIITAHIKECDGRDARNTKTFDDVKLMFKGIWDTMDENRKEDILDKKSLKDDITRIQIRWAYVLGAFFAIGKIIDWYLQFHQITIPLLHSTP